MTSFVDTNPVACIIFIIVLVVLLYGINSCRKGQENLSVSSSHTSLPGPVAYKVDDPNSCATTCYPGYVDPSSSGLMCLCSYGPPPS